MEGAVAPLKIHVVLERVTAMVLLMAERTMATEGAEVTLYVVATTAESLVFTTMKKMTAVTIQLLLLVEVVGLTFLNIGVSGALGLLVTKIVELARRKECDIAMAVDVLIARKIRNEFASIRIVKSLLVNQDRQKKSFTQYSINEW